jgi:hypothetical protein
MYQEIVKFVQLLSQSTADCDNVTIVTGVFLCGRRDKNKVRKVKRNMGRVRGG